MLFIHVLFTSSKLSSILSLCKSLWYRFIKNILTVVLNGQTSSWADVNAGVPQGSILGPLLFLIYINDLADGLSSNAKLFADDTSLFSVVHNANTTAKKLNNDLVKDGLTNGKWASILILPNKLRK